MGSAEAITGSAELAARTIRTGEPVAITVSAMSGVTDSLLGIAAKAEKGNLQGALEDIAVLRSRHLSTVEALGASSTSETSRELRELMAILLNTVTGVGLLHELSPRSRDLVVSFGERLSAPLMALALENLGIRAHHMTGGQAGLVTDSVFGGAKPLPEAANLIRERVGGLLANGLTPVVAGFIGETTDGVITTLGRGGTDYTATILGAALGAREVWTWKEVDGVMSADPRLVPDARNLAVLSYAEVMELAYFGAKVLHPLAVMPLQEHGIPLRVKGAADPDDPGTLVTERTQTDAGHPVKAVTAIRGLAVLTVGGAGMVGVPDIVSQIFQVLAREEVNVHMISQGSSQANVSILVSSNQSARAMEVLQAALGGTRFVRDFALHDGVAIVAIVGEGMRGTRGVAARLFGALADAGVNILSIAQGSSELNISFAVEETDVARAVSSVHAAFDLGTQRQPA